jgi:ABC-type uncharacterized transport system permease subunit
MNQYFLAAPILAYIPCLISINRIDSGHNRKGILIGTAFGLHIIVLLISVVLSPNTWFSSPALSLYSLSAGLTFCLILLRTVRPKLSVLDNIILPISVSLMVMASLSPSVNAGLSAETWLMVHFLCILLGILSFTFAFSFATTFLFQQQRLKEKNFEGINRYPSLDTLDTFNYYAIVIGFVSLSIGVITGYVWSVVQAKVLQIDITIISTLALWFWYAVGLHTRLYMGRRGRWAAWFSVFGFVLFFLMMLVGVSLTGGWHLGAIQ